MTNVCFGSKADITFRSDECPLYLQSRLLAHANRCLLCANSGHEAILSEGFKAQLYGLGHCEPLADGECP